MDVGIIGYGFVGRATHRSIQTYRSKHEVSIFDPAYMNSDLDAVKKTEICFICVPTPTRERQDLSALEDALKSLDRYEGLVVIKSTILPITWDYINMRFHHLNLMVAPEFLSQHNPYYPQEHLLGVKDLFQAELYDRLLPGGKITDPRCACMIKYVHNCFGALKVSFFHEIFETCQKERISYREMLRLLLQITDHIGKTYTTPFLDGKPGFGGACFPKDVKAFQQQYSLLSLAAAENLNKSWRP